MQGKLLRDNIYHSVIFILNLLIISLISISPFIWIVKDGLGPSAVDSSGLEALYRFFITFYFGPTIIALLENNPDIKQQIDDLSSQVHTLLTEYESK